MKVNTKKGIIYKKYDRNKDYKCSCGGDFIFDGEGISEFPVGFGFVNGVFGVTKIIYKGWIGECGCGKKIMAYKSKRIKHKKIDIPGRIR